MGCQGKAGCAGIYPHALFKSGAEETCANLQAQQLCGVLEEHGEKYLETWQVPLLTWEELQELKQLYEAAPMPNLESPGSGEQSLLISTTTSSQRVSILNRSIGCCLNSFPSSIRKPRERSGFSCSVTAYKSQSFVNSFLA